MTVDDCPFERDLIEALRPRRTALPRRDAAGAPPAAAGALPAPLAAHLESCPACRRSAAVSGALARLADARDPDPLPDPRRLYWRAQILERLSDKQRAAERATRPVRVAQAVAALLAAVAVSALLGGVWQVLGQHLTAVDLPLPGASPSDLAMALVVAAGIAFALAAGAGIALLETFSER